MNLKTPALVAVLLSIGADSLFANVVFSESFESPVVSGFDDKTVPSGSKWIGSTDGYGATNRGLYNETVGWPTMPAFSSLYGKQAYFTRNPKLIAAIRHHHLAHKGFRPSGQHLWMQSASGPPTLVHQSMAPTVWR